jgi:hypothetical protein
MNRISFFIFIVCSLSLWGCGKKNAPVPPDRGLPAGFELVTTPSPPPPAPVAIRTNDLPAPADTNAESSAISPEPNDDGFPQATNDVERLRQAGDFAEAIEKLAKLQESFPRHADEIAGMTAKTKEERRTAMDLEFAVRQLGKDDPTAADVAVQKLTDGGEVARIVLRKSVRKQDDGVAVEAVALLTDLGDERAAEEIVGRLLKRPDTPIRPQLLDALKKLAGVASGSVIAPLYPFVKSDSQFRCRDIADVIGVYLNKTCDGKGDNLNKALGEPEAFEQLKKYINDAMNVTNDIALMRWASNQALYFQLFIPGIRVQYYDGVNFDKMLVEKKDEYIWIDDRKFQFPDGRQDNLSIRWEGKLLVKNNGKYTFKVASDDGNRLWIDGKSLFDQWGNAASLSGSADLEAGLHDIRVEFQQISGSGWIHMTWSGPGFDEKPLTKDNLRIASPPKPQPTTEKKP